MYAKHTQSMGCLGGVDDVLAIHHEAGSIRPAFKRAMLMWIVLPIPLISFGSLPNSMVTSRTGKAAQTDRHHYHRVRVSRPRLCLIAAQITDSHHCVASATVCCNLKRSSGLRPNFCASLELILLHHCATTALKHLVMAVIGPHHQS